MESQKQQVVDRLKQATNILVTVSTNPSVDQLAGAIGLTLLLNKMNKHGTAVYSGETPSTIEFLKPEETLEKNTDSLRDFIIALDKAKADKLRYKVEEKVVKIFITPYRTSIGEGDLNFSQGDFNVDVVICLGVHDQQDLDQAITAHGRILHDATVIGISNTQNEIGSVNWFNEAASSLCEMIVDLGDNLEENVLDEQIATALLTGIVAETDRFSNEKTTPLTMSVSSKLMAAGANQQLVATKLQEPPQQPPEEEPPVKPDAPQPDVPPMSDSDGHSTDADVGNVHDEPSEPEQKPEKDPGLIEIGHHEENKKVIATPEKPNSNQIHIDEEGTMRPLADVSGPLSVEDVEMPAGAPSNNISTGLYGSGDEGAESKNDKNSETVLQPSHLVLQPPTRGGTLTASSKPEELEPSTDPLSLPTVNPSVTNDAKSGPAVENGDTLINLERKVHSPHLAEENEEVGGRKDGAAPGSSLSPTLEDARNAVASAVAAHVESESPEPIAALNAQPVFDSLHPAASLSDQKQPDVSTEHPGSTMDMPFPAPQNPTPASPANGQTNNNQQSPPPVPPPMTFPS